MLNIAGYRVQKECLCSTCAERAIRHEFDVKTQAEMDFLFFPYVQVRTRQETWPVRFKEHDYEDPYIYDSEGAVIMAYDMRVHDDDPIRAVRKEVKVLFDDDNYLDEVHCANCGELLIEAYTLTCTCCDVIFMRGSNAVTIERLYKDNFMLLCGKCFAHNEQTARAEIAAKVEEQMALSEDKEYWLYNRRLGLFVVQEPDKKGFIQMVLDFFIGMPPLEIGLSSLHDVLSLLEGNMSIAETTENKVDATIIAIMREVCQNTPYLMVPAHVLYERLEQGESISESDLLAL